MVVWWRNNPSVLFLPRNSQTNRNPSINQHDSPSKVWMLSSAVSDAPTKFCAIPVPAMFPRNWIKSATTTKYSVEERTIPKVLQLSAKEEIKFRQFRQRMQFPRVVLSPLVSSSSFYCCHPVNHTAWRSSPFLFFSLVVGRPPPEKVISVSFVPQKGIPCTFSGV